MRCAADPELKGKLVGNFYMDCAEVNVGSDSYIALVLLKEALAFTVFLMRT